MSELKPCPMTADEAIDEIKRWTPALFGMGPDCTDTTMKAQEMAIDALRRAQPANEPLTKISEMLEQAAQEMDDKCRQWQCVLQRVHDAGTFDQNSGLWVGIDKEREAKAQASFEAYRYALEVIDKIAEHVSNPYKSAHKPGGGQE